MQHPVVLVGQGFHPSKQQVKVIYQQNLHQNNQKSVRKIHTIIEGTSKNLFNLRSQRFNHVWADSAMPEM